MNAKPYLARGNYCYNNFLYTEKMRKIIENNIKMIFYYFVQSLKMEGIGQGGIGKFILSEEFLKRRNKQIKKIYGIFIFVFHLNVPFRELREKGIHEFIPFLFR